MQKEILKKGIKKNYGKIALEGNVSNTCCSPSSSQEICCDKNNISNEQISSMIGYNITELKSIPEESIIGLGCGAPLNFVDIKKGVILVDLGSVAGIDAIFDI
jgi:arsenite methyltransferase